MNTTTKQTLPRNAALLAGLLERLEAGHRAGAARTGVADATQYRDVAARLALELDSLPHDSALEALLSASPVAATVYENLNYGHAGLCRSLLDAAAASEISARQLIARAGRRAASANCTTGP